MNPMGTPVPGLPAIIHYQDWLSICVTGEGDGRNKDYGRPILDWVLQQGIVTVDTVTAPFGLPLLHTAAIDRCPGVIRVLLKHGADPSKKAGRSDEAAAAAAFRSFDSASGRSLTYSALEVAQEWYESFSTAVHALPVISCLAPAGTYLLVKNDDKEATVKCFWLLSGKIRYDQPLPKSAVRQCPDAAYSSPDAANAHALSQAMLRVLRANAAVEAEEQALAAANQSARR